MKKSYLGVLLIVAAAVVAYLIWSQKEARSEQEVPVVIEESVPVFVPDPKTKYLKIPEQATFGEFMTEQGVDPAVTAAIYEVALTNYDLALVRAGRRLDLQYDDAQNLIKLSYDIDDQKQLVVYKEEGLWKAKVQAIEYKITNKLSQGTIDSSLYEAALAAGLDEGLVIEMAEAFGSTIDFSMDVKSGDSFKVLYEARERDAMPAKPGRVLAARYINDGQSYFIYLWTDDKGKDAYYDEQGRAALKRFLRAPVAFRYISSGYTNNPRYVGGQYQRFTANHLAIDYAAAQGTPIRAVGDGRVSFAGWKNGYGNVVTIRHDSTYSTTYGHMSKILVKNGQVVGQNQTIGLVGSTGFSTGPHVHFEMIKNGVKVNPLKEIQPPSAPLSGEDLATFNKQRELYQAELDK